MSIYSTTTVLNHLSDADFRAWGAEFKSSLTAVGLTNTADTGQIDWTTVTIPGGTGQAGYETWRFNDSLQGSNPIFIRFDFGSLSIGVPGIWVQVGTGTDGVGNLTGLVSTSLTPMVLGDAIASGVTPYANYFCYSTVVGALTIAWKLGSDGVSAPGRGLCMIGRSCNTSGAPTSAGVTIYTGGVSPAIAQSIAFGVATYAQHQNYGIVVGNVIGSAVGVNVQAYLNWAHYPRVEPVNWACSLITGEFPRVLFTTTLVGATAHTYLGLGINSPVSSPGSNNADYSFGMLYE